MFNAAADRLFVATDALKQQAIQNGIAEELLLCEHVQVILLYELLLRERVQVKSHFQFLRLGLQRCQ